ncbi:hypothetical protein P168DRAFT_289020 [Aspergillus campestris IBT 28561]|uniref:Uncharacterized protein n=1 Tax=Aspergillus campestris (strain IBT 28561) TaxID=1392248 RepID=A0A2I1D6Q9_ASPC2|nr:uncharacterized protein P168DRAFT_289020 [Aspergillus campestris IBT 28561]PKY05562.1 hypothetical protein P168DRAFT_289020 [Aspergillus campestris IBT 28561]
MATNINSKPTTPGCDGLRKKPKDAESKSDLEDNQISDEDSNDETPSGKRKLMS